MDEKHKSLSEIVKSILSEYFPTSKEQIERLTAERDRFKEQHKLCLDEIERLNTVGEKKMIIKVDLSNEDFNTLVNEQFEISGKQEGLVQEVSNKITRIVKEYIKQMKKGVYSRDCE